MDRLLYGAAIAALMVSAASRAAAQPAPAPAGPASTPTNSPPAEAADSVTDGGLVIVTGSRIARDPLSLAAPVTFLDKTALERTGLSSTADILQRLPISGGGLNTRNNASGNLGNPPDGGGVGAGSATIDLRYLGPNRTLVLIDGLRVVPGASASGIPAAVDLNIIPNGAIERIEVLQDGASPIYGSDAIAGVVNIILKSKQRGFDATARLSGYFEQGDGTTQDYSLSYGAGNDRLNVVVGGSYTKQDPVFASDRAISRFPVPYATSCTAGGCSSATVNGRFDIFNPVGGGFLSLALRQPTQTRPVFDPLNPTGANTSFKAFGVEDRFNFKPFNYLLTPNERYGGFVNASYDFGGITGRVKAFYNERNSANQAAPLPLFLGPGGGNGNLLDTISIDSTNPFNPFGITLNSGANGGAVTYDTVRRRLIEAGPRNFQQHVETFYITGTLEGGFRLFDRKFTWDVNVIYGSNKANQSFTGNVNAARVQQALGPVAQCTAPCVPLNVFGGQGTITAAQLAFIGFTQRDRSKQELTDVTVNLAGELFDLPGGPLGFAAGYEHRYQFGSFDPDPIIVAGLGADIPAQPGRGSLTADELYAEFRAPILKDVVFVKQLEASFAVRYSNYSIFGDTTNLKAGFLYQPRPDITIRGNWAQGFRAPSIGELFGGASRFDNVLIDPCNNSATLPANVRANCIANGVPAAGNYIQDGGTGGGQISLITGGSTALKPETSTSYTAGIVFSPPFLRDTSFSRRVDLEVNYYDITLSGAVRAIGGDTLLGRCALTGDPLSCASIVRSRVTGNVLRINALLQNIGAITTNGIDATVSYRSPDTRAGRFGLFFAGNYLLNYNEQVPATTGFTKVKRAGTERGSPDQAYPRFKATTQLDWTFGRFTTNLTGRFIDSVRDTADAIELKSRYYLDVSIDYRLPFLNDSLLLSVGVNNVTNSDPPACPACNNGAFDPGTYDVPGRFGFVRLTYRGR
jgi:iron complex outermembrane receptor protein